MEEYIVVKTVANNIVEYGKAFDNKIEAVEQAERLNQLAKEDGWPDLVRFSVLSCEVTSKKSIVRVEVKAKLLGLIAHALQTSGGDSNKVSAELAETIGLQLLADLISQLEK